MISRFFPEVLANQATLPRRGEDGETGGEFRADLLLVLPQPFDELPDGEQGFWRQGRLRCRHHRDGAQGLGMHFEILKFAEIVLKLFQRPDQRRNFIMGIKTLEKLQKIAKFFTGLAQFVKVFRGRAVVDGGAFAQGAAQNPANTGIRHLRHGESGRLRPGKIAERRLGKPGAPVGEDFPEARRGQFLGQLPLGRPLVGHEPFAQGRKIAGLFRGEEVVVAVEAKQMNVEIPHRRGDRADPGEFGVKTLHHRRWHQPFELTESGPGATDRHPKIVQEFAVQIPDGAVQIAFHGVEQLQKNCANGLSGRLRGIKAEVRF